MTQRHVPKKLLAVAATLALVAGCNIGRQDNFVEPETPQQQQARLQKSIDAINNNQQMPAEAKKAAIANIEAQQKRAEEAAKAAAASNKK